MKKSIRIITLLFLIIVQYGFAQENVIKGFVSSGSDPLPGVSIIIKGTSVGTETDFDGNYSIKASKGDILVFRYLGI